jgi:signal transduction histidine kinase/CheY-like chemotaxis protein
MGEGIAGWVALHARPLLLNTRRDLGVFLSDDRPAREIDSALCVPLKGQGETLGVLNVNRIEERRGGKFDDRHRKILAIYADYAAHAIENLRVYRELADAHARLEESWREVRLVQEQLIHSEKMSTIGQLISEVSHELNNPLTTTVGYAQLLGRINRDPEVAEYLDVIRNEGLRCQRIIQNLLDFARKHQGEPEPVDLNVLVEKTVALRRAQLVVGGIEIETELDSGLPFVVADPSRLQQVILNLLNNAAQAIEGERGKGRIRFGTSFEPEDGAVVLTVEDDGPGIPEALRERIFEPFYTTKEAGRGTGLGLSVCRGIVEEGGGRIRAEPSADGGARFVISLLTGPPPAAPSSTEEEPASTVESAEILVVDDDPQVLRLLSRTLSLDGHRVVTADAVEGALELAADADFDLVLTDLRMPGESGLDLHARLVRERPELAERVVFFTGGAVGEEIRAELDRRGRPVLHKPFQEDELREVVRGGGAPRSP